VEVDELKVGNLMECPVWPCSPAWRALLLSWHIEPTCLSAGEDGG